jgi:hypothetical protein
MAHNWMGSPFERRSIQPAMKVRTADGTVLGRVALIGETVLFVRRRFSRQLRAVPLARLKRVTGRCVYVAGRPDEVLEPVGERLRTEIPTHVHPLAEPPWTGLAPEHRA